MATWHQLNAPQAPLFHPTDWTVVIDPPNQMRALVRHATRALADVYMRNLEDNNPSAFAHSYVLKPGKVTR
jgi:hypothetical protein